MKKTTAGIRCQYVDGKLWVNGIDVEALIDLYKSKPEPKIRAYLLSWRNKLCLLLSKQGTSGRFNGCHEAANRLFCELEATLKSYPDCARLLNPGHRI